MLRLIARIFALTALLLSSLAAADGSRAELEAYFSDTDSMEGSFTQVVRDEDGRVVEESRGTMAIQRPDRFDWVYREPFEQRIVADGERLWIHDPDLRQVTVRPLEDTLGTGPALLLSGRMETLDEHFRMDEEDGWLVLTPRTDEWNVEGVRLRMANGVPKEVIVRDGLGQENRLTLEDVTTGVSFEPGRFRFEPDDGTDVIEQGEAAP